jgi:hypothetical protein
VDRIRDDELGGEDDDFGCVCMYYMCLYVCMCVSLCIDRVGDDELGGSMTILGVYVSYVLHVCVCIHVREREKKRERESVCVCVLRTSAPRFPYIHTYIHTGTHTSAPRFSYNHT